MSADDTTAISESQHHSILIFGASGDLTARKLMPALFTLWSEGFLPDDTPIFGVARREKTDEGFREEMQAAVSKHGRMGEISDEKWDEFAKRLFYHRLDLDTLDGYVELHGRVEKTEAEIFGPSVKASRVVYLAITPTLFLPSVENLCAGGFKTAHNETHRLRVVVEKPFGRDLSSSLELSSGLNRLLDESQIYRIDHYLGKETVQNILLFRFGNAIFEPLLNRNHVDHIQITMSEDQGIESGRGGYYDTSGALRDVLQNHVLQLLCLVAMEPPAVFLGDQIRDEKVKVLESLRPGSENVDEWAIAGQYVGGTVDGEAVNGYRQEDRVAPNSRRETFVGMEVYVDNWRWAHVPFYLRTGKRLPKRVTEIAIQFKLPPMHPFSTVECDSNGEDCGLVGSRPNSLVFRIQPEESITLSCSVKQPGHQYNLERQRLKYQYPHGLAEAYERLLLDVMRGDSTLFTRSDELEAAWRFVQPVLDHWESDKHQPEFYQVDTWGPQAADKLLSKSGREWREP